MSSTDYVEFDVGQVKGTGWTAEENAAWSELVRSLSSFARAVVKHLTADNTLLQYVQKVFDDAIETAQAELHLLQVCQDFEKASLKAAAQTDQEQLASKVARIIMAKTKRIKQHSRRAATRAQKHKVGGANSVRNKARWPPAIAETAENFESWRVDLLMHISMLVVSNYFESQGMLVNRRDDSRTKQEQKQIKKLFHFHATEIGVEKFELKGFALLCRTTGLLVKPYEADQSQMLCR